MTAYVGSGIDIKARTSQEGHKKAQKYIEEYIGSNMKCTYIYNTKKLRKPI